LKTLIVTEIEHVAHVKLNRPDVRNAFNPEMIAELTTLFRALDQRDDLRAVTLSGEGKAFCAGADLAWMKSMVHFNFEQNKEDSEKLFNMFESIARCSLPVVGCVHSAGFGGALGLLAGCDYVITDSKAQFAFSEVKLGIAPAVISDFLMRKIPVAFLQPLMISGQIFNAERALQIGLVHEVITIQSDLHHEMNQRLVHYLAHLKQAGPVAVRETKKLLSTLASYDAAEKKQATTSLIAKLRVSAEGQEGLNSFIDKRSPEWTK